MLCLENTQKKCIIINVCQFIIYTMGMVYILSCPQDLENLLYSDNIKWYPDEVIKKFRHQYRIIAGCTTIQEMYALTSLRLHKLHWNLEWLYGIDLTKWWRLELRIVSWISVEIIRISNHYAK